MSLIFKPKTVYLEGVCGPEEAETLLEWLLEHPKGAVNLKKCVHLHTAVLQVLMVFKPKFSVVPLSATLQSTLKASKLISTQ